MGFDVVEVTAQWGFDVAEVTAKWFLIMWRLSYSAF